MGISKGLKRVPAFLEALILKYDFGLVKLPGLSRNGPQGHIGRWRALLPLRSRALRQVA